MSPGPLNQILNPGASSVGVLQPALYTCALSRYRLKSLNSPPTQNSCYNKLLTSVGIMPRDLEHLLPYLSAIDVPNKDQPTFKKIISLCKPAVSLTPLCIVSTGAVTKGTNLIRS